MKFKLTTLAILFLALLATACKDEKGGAMQFTLEGTLNGAAGKTLYIEEMTPDNGALFLDSLVCDQKGHFSYKGTMNYQTFYNLHTSQYEYIVLLPDDKEHIVISGDFVQMSEHYQVSGSKGSQQMWEIQNHINNANHVIADIAQRDQYNKANLNAADYERAHQETDSIFIAERQLIYVTFYNFIEDHRGSLSTLYAIDAPFNHTGRVFYAEPDFEVFEMVLSGLLDSVADNPHTQYYKTRVERARSARMMAQQQQQPGQEIIIK